AVGELLSAPFSTTVNMGGGAFFIILALSGLIISLAGSFKRPKNHFAEMIILGVFFLFTTIMAFGAQRFILLWVVPLCALFPLGLKYAFEWTQRRLPERIFMTISLGTALIMVVLRVQSSYLQTPLLLNKIYNEVW